MRKPGSAGQPRKEGGVRSWVVAAAAGDRPAFEHSPQAAALEEHSGRPIVLLAPSVELCLRAMGRVRSLGYRVSESQWIQHSSRRFGWVAVAIEVLTTATAEGRSQSDLNGGSTSSRWPRDEEG